MFHFNFNQKLLILYFLLGGIFVAEGSSNFSITPPPIPWYEFGQGKNDLKLMGTYLSVSGDGISMKGGLASFAYREGFSDIMAIDVGANMGGASGTFGSSTNSNLVSNSNTDMSMFIFSFAPNIEIQPVKTDHFGMILFGGVAMDMQRTKITMPATAWTSGSMSTSVFMYGFQGGVELSGRIWDITLSPFYMFQYKTGYAYTSGYSQSIPSFHTNSFGADISYVPWSTTLSSLLQLKPNSGSSSTKIYTFNLSYTLHWDRATSAPVEGLKKEEAKPEIKEEKTPSIPSSTPATIKPEEKPEEVKNKTEQEASTTVQEVKKEETPTPKETPK